MPKPDKSPSPPDEQAQSAPNDNREMASENYIAVYNSSPMSHIQQNASSQSFSTSVYPSNPHWQYAPHTYADMPPGTYYQQSNIMVPAGASSPQFIPPYPGWQGSPPANLHPQTFVPQNQVYYTPPDSSAAARESGPSRTKRIRRRSAQDAMGTPSPIDAETFDLADGASLSTTKRTKPGSNVSSSGDLKSFSCTMCSATFTRKGDCLRHTRSVHTRETPYDCQGCGEMFSRSDMRGKHWKMDPNCEKVHWREVCVAMGRTSLLEPET